MNITQQNGSLDPVSFSNWVQQVAHINENMSEALRDTADALADFDTLIAMRLYQAADAANLTAQHLRQSAPATKANWAADFFFGAGMLCGFIVHLAGSFRRK